MFAKFFKIVERNPRKFLEFLATKAKITKILARETKKVLHQSNTRSIDILLALAIILENSENGLLLCVFLSEPQLGLTNEA